MDIKIIARGVGYFALAGALFGAAIALNNREYPTTEASRTEPSPATAALDAELAHCQAIGSEAADAATCKAVWESNRRRFFESGKLYRDRVIDFVPATPDSNKPAAPWAREAPRSAGQSLSTPNSSAPQRSGDIAGRPQ